METKKRTIIIGDTHGCVDEFNELIQTLSYDKDQDRIILTGDLIDRGPDSVGMVRLAREMELESVMGNHEYKFLKWFRSAGSNVDVYHKREHYTKFSDADINYISQMQPYIKIDNTIIVHAGLRAGISLENQTKDDLYYIRYMDAESKFISLKKIWRYGVALSVFFATALSVQAQVKPSVLPDELAEAEAFWCKRNYCHGRASPRS
jgi:hypothetical protein